MGRKDARIPKSELRKIAVENINELADLSSTAGDQNLARRYNEMIDLIAERMDITLPQGIKRKFCKKCFTPYDSSSRLRLKKGIAVIRCAKCGDVRRIPYGAGKQAIR